MENMLGSICIYTFNFHFAKVLNRDAFVILIVTMMAVITMMIMIKKNEFEDNYYNDDAISDSTSKFFLVSALLGEKLRKKEKTFSIIRCWWGIRISGRRHSHKYTLYPFFSFSLASLILLIDSFIHPFNIHVLGTNEVLE